MEGLGLPHAIILIVILLVFFGPSRLPALGQSIGKAIRGFKEGMNETQNEINKTNSEINQLPPSNDASTKNDSLNKKAETKSNQNNS